MFMSMADKRIVGVSIHRATGAPLPHELADIAQSVSTIVTTPVGSRIRRRSFGSHLFDLIDSPATAAGALRVIAAAADPIERWERRVQFLRGELRPGFDGAVSVTVYLAVRAASRPLTVDIAVRAVA